MIAVAEEWGWFDRFVWSFVDEVTNRSGFRTLDAIPAATEESRAMSKELKRRGFEFAGPTICNAFMQAVGMVNDHPGA